MNFDRAHVGSSHRVVRTPTPMPQNPTPLKPMRAVGCNVQGLCSLKPSKTFQESPSIPKP